MHKNKRNLVWVLIVMFIVNFLPMSTVKAVDDINIISKTDITADTAKKWARQKGGTETFIALADLYWKYASTNGGVNPAVAYVQAAKETGYGNFGGVIDESYNNPCGMKISQGGLDSDPNAHKRFNNWSEGVQAHLDHLALYAGAQGYPRTTTYDPRHFPEIKGKATTVTALGGNWAPSTSYGTEMVSLYREMGAQEVNTRMDGVIDTPQYNASVSGDTLRVSGWALNSSGIAKVNVYVDGKLKGEAHIGESRPDVKAAYPSYSEAGTSGYSATVDIKDISSGAKTVKVEQIGKNNTINRIETKVNISRPTPIQVIDYPSNNSTINGNSLSIGGWSLNSYGIKEIKIYVDGQFKGNANIGGSRPDVKAVYPQYSNAGTSGYNATVDITNIAGGNRKVKVEQVASNGETNVSETTVYVNKPTPIQVIDYPSNNSTVNGNSLSIGGWSLNNDGIKEIKIYVDGQLKGNANIGGSRPDVKAVYPQYSNAGTSGYNATVDITNIAGGNRNVKVEQVASNGETNVSETTVYVNKPTPIQVIDYPSNNSTVNGKSLSIGGWSLNNDGIKEIKIYVDGQLKGNANIGGSRPDVKAVYPQYSNAGTSGYNATVDIANVAEGNRKVKVEQVGSNGQTYISEININVKKPHPITVIDSPSNNSNINGNSLSVGGWALNASGVKSINVYIDGTLMKTTTTGFQRADVGSIYPQYSDNKSGYSATFDISNINGGNRTLKVEQVGNDGTKDAVSTTIYVNKAVPISTVDYPSSGVDVKSKQFTVRGWALNSSGVKEVQIYVDGKFKGKAHIGESRPDVGNVYPNYVDSSKSGFSLNIDVNDIAPGARTITTKEIGNDGTVNSTYGKFNLIKKVAVTVLDAPADGQLETSDNLYVGGWALNDSGVRNINIYLDGVKATSTTLNVSRTDVIAAYPGYQTSSICGFSTSVNLSNLAKGAHKIILESIGVDGSVDSISKTIYYKEKPGKLIVVDPGHNYGKDGGAEDTINGVYYSETELNMQVAMKLYNDLIAQGYSVKLTRQPWERDRSDLATSLYNRALLANNSNADLFISVHHNKVETEDARGSEVYYTERTSGDEGMPPHNPDKFEKSRDLAIATASSITSKTGFRNRGGKGDVSSLTYGLSVLRNTKMPAILVECGFISNPEEAALLATSSNQQATADGIAQAVKQRY